MRDYWKTLLEDDIYYDEANPKYRCLFNLYHVARVTRIFTLLHTLILLAFVISYFPYSFVGLPVIITLISVTVFSLVNEHSLTLIPFYAYLTVLSICNALIIAALVVYGFINYRQTVTLLGYPNLHSLPVGILLILSAKLTFLVLLVIFAWQAHVVAKCRQYFDDKLDFSNYVRLAVPESFTDTKITDVKMLVKPIGPLVPEYVLFSLSDDNAEVKIKLTERLSNESSSSSESSSNDHAIR
uniref:Uncharacterized protein n=1 Tax=Panagrellus redivivus TaxID=6233 RepID=A0A7E4UPR0_PANRE